MQVLTLGSEGAETQLVQKLLNDYYKGRITGKYDDATRNAVSNFQRDNNLPEDGIVWPGVWDVLRPRLLGFNEYTYTEGDTPASVAEKFGADEAAVRAANLVFAPGARIIVPLRRRVVFTDVLYTYTLLQINIEGLRARYPFLDISIIGGSVLNNHIYCIRLGKGPRLLTFNAAHHANEWITTPVAMKFIESFCLAYINGGRIAGVEARELFEDCSIYIVPMVNPDGVNLVCGQYGNNSIIYKRLSELYTLEQPFPYGWKANIEGVDLNLNYPAGWDLAKQFKAEQGVTSPGPRDYVGKYPLSEPETQAMAAFTREHLFLSSISLHTQGKLIYWKYSSYEPAYSQQIGQELARVSGYSLELTPEQSGYAGYKDWFILTYNLPAYTVECGAGVSPLPLSQFDEIYAACEPLMVSLCVQSALLAPAT